MKYFRTLKFLTFIVLLIPGINATGQDDDLDQLSSGIQYIESSYTDISDQFTKKEIPYDSLKGTIQVLIFDRDSLFTISTSLNKSLNKLTVSLSALGPLPSDGDPAEPDNVVAKRSKLNNQITTVDGYQSTTNDLLDEVGKLISDISDYRSSVFLSGITDRTSSPFSKDLWTASFRELKSVISSIIDYKKSFWKEFWDDKKRGNILLLLVSVLLSAAVLLFPFSAFGKRINNAISLKSKNPKLEKKLKFIVFPGLKAIVVLVALSLLYLAAVEIDLVTVEVESISKQFVLWTSLAVFLWFFAKNLFSSDALLWNRISSAPESAQGNRWLFIGMMYTYISDNILTGLFTITDGGMRLLMAQSIVTTSIYAVLLLLFFSPKRWIIADKSSNDVSDKKGTSKLNPTDEKAHSDRKKITSEIVFFVGRAIAVGLLLIMSLKYLQMANFIFHRLVLLVLFYILFASVRTLALWAILGMTKNMPEPSKTSNKTVSSRTSLDFWLSTAVDAVLLLLSVPALLFVFGKDWVDVNNWMQMFFTGFKIGNITISFKNIFDALFTFLLIIVVVRWSTSIINKRLTQYTDIDVGVRNSIITLMNYAGVVVALFTAIPMMGFNFSNVTVVAGALSVGIGFGLQNIVKDFVSGLILLFDRPIKIGDWVVIETGEGYVKEIKSRVTIIQTFDRSNIIVPNSDLVNRPVQNWFYGNKQGRVSVKVGVSFDSDPELVKEVLLKCATNHPSILASPKPYVLWQDFGESTINFELRGYISNSDNTFLVRSDLHFSIFKALKDAGITIPFPQRDLHIVETEPSSSGKHVEKPSVHGVGPVAPNVKPATAKKVAAVTSKTASATKPAAKKPAKSTKKSTTTAVKKTPAKKAASKKSTAANTPKVTNKKDTGKL